MQKRKKNEKELLSKGNSGRELGTLQTCCLHRPPANKGVESWENSTLLSQSTQHEGDFF